MLCVTGFQPHEIADPDDYEPFQSDISRIGGGRNWIVRNGRRLSEFEGDAWIKMMLRIGRTNDHYEQRQVRKGKVGYYRRMVRDRMQLSETDKTHRPKTDVTSACGSCARRSDLQVTSDSSRCSGTRRATAPTPRQAPGLVFLKGGDKVFARSQNHVDHGGAHR